MWLFRLIQHNPRVGWPVFFVILIVGAVFRATDKSPTRAESAAMQFAQVRQEVESKTAADCLAEKQFSAGECQCFASKIGASVTEADLRGTSNKKDLEARARILMKGCLNAAPVAAPVVLTRCKVNSEPAGASINVDGKTSDGVTPLSAEMAVGRANTVTASLPGFKTVSKAFSPASAADCGETLWFTLLAARNVKFISKPEGATLFVDGVRVTGTTPLNLELEVTPHEVAFTMPGRSTVKKTIEAGTGKLEVAAELHPVAFIELTSAPDGAEVWVDGVKVQGMTPTAVEVPSGGVHFLTLAKDGFLPKSVPLGAMAPGDSTEKAVTLGRGGKAQIKSCASKVQKKGSSPEVAAKRAEAEWCLAHR